MKHIIIAIALCSACKKQEVKPEQSHLYGILKDWDLDQYRNIEGKPIYPTYEERVLPDSKAKTDTVEIWFEVYKKDYSGYTEYLDYRVKRKLITTYKQL